MSADASLLSAPRPSQLADLTLPRRRQFFPSPVDWRNEVLYFLLVDRFSDGGEAQRPLLDRGDRDAAHRDGGVARRWRVSGMTPFLPDIERRSYMKLRLVVLFLASLAVASLASAQGGCLDCVSGTCQQSADGHCDRTCCNRSVGASCLATTRTLECVTRSPVPYYFTSRMPQQTEGSALRLQYAPPLKAPPMKCTAAI